MLATNKILAILVALIVVSCANPILDANEQFIQGSWFYWRQIEQVGFTYWIRWTFEQGRFKQEGRLLHIEGRYRIVKSDDDQLTLELSEVSDEIGQRIELSEPQINIVIDRNTGILTIKQEGSFTREQIVPTAAP